ncbi:inositol monophosphatase family protein [Epibacterium ulvae]|uniref:inositol monophosphatase family protein n=1 Tax=Epibacterium ulvae TaxID=1156985 RepID=UPI0024901F53|nr:inositol monophosphatase family protein [Epibacterium ulvae]
MTDAFASSSAFLPASASPLMRDMAHAAYLAGEALVGFAKDRSALTLQEKTAGDFVSSADLKSEAIIATWLKTRYPDFGWVGEETGAQITGFDEPYWVVDPLDGTSNFLKGLPHWAVSIALCKGDVPIAAIVYDPVKEELFSAERGCGAFLNGARIWVNSDISLSTAILATGVPAGGRVTYLSDCLMDLEQLMPKSAGIRRWGAAALDLAYVAAGRLDAYWERNLGPWDIAAGWLLVQEAGGCVEPLWSGEPILESGSLLAGDAALLRQVHPYLTPKH